MNNNIMCSVWFSNAVTNVDPFDTMLEVFACKWVVLPSIVFHQTKTSFLPSWKMVDCQVIWVEAAAWSETLQFCIKCEIEWIKVVQTNIIYIYIHSIYSLNFYNYFIERHSFTFIKTTCILFTTLLLDICRGSCGVQKNVHRKTTFPVSSHIHALLTMKIIFMKISWCGMILVRWLGIILVYWMRSIRTPLLKQ